MKIDHPVQAELHKKLEEQLAPSHLELVNESPQHGLPATAEKHFRVVVVAALFADLTRIERHRLVHEAVATELKEQVHALSVQAYTPKEWLAKAEEAFASPECLGGGKRKPIS